MSQVHFVIVAEPTRPFLNMAALLVYSLRRHGGRLRDSPATIVVNGSLPLSDDEEMLRSFDHVDVRVMPRIAGTPHTNKFNAFYAVEDSYDVLAYLDCDMVVMNTLDGMCDGLKAFEALPIGGAGANQVQNYEGLIQRFALSKSTSIDALRDNRYRNGYPLFNTGTMVLTRSALHEIREDALKLSYELHEQYLQEHQLPKVFPRGVRWAWNGIWNRIMERFRTDVEYPHWMTEQLGLSLALLKNGVRTEPLDQRLNWTSDESPIGTGLPSIYHYMSGLHDIDRSRLFEGEWVDRYAKSDTPTRRKLAELVRSFPYRP